MIRLAFRAPADQAEIVLAALIDIAPSGVEQVDGEGFTEFAVYGAPGELPSFPEGDAEVGGVVVQVSGREVPDDWAERWKRFHRPVLIGGKVYVRPPWEGPALRPGVTEIVIDPGQAFGTGTHPTTALCLELMLELKPRGSFADLGCGSGVLAIAAAKLGFGPITAVDAEREAVRATKMNANVNGVRIDRIERGDLRNQPAPKADVVAANLMRPLLLRVAESWQGEPPPTLIVSGLLDHEAGEVAVAFAPLTEQKRLSSLGWSALLLTSS
ncbi:MAG TPA: 50S ribosomal protein L11 methyltransferase [Thermoleophilaceae bacterium]|nr:50S ribosomal protein L11 methyltransferase [Thermoleophilaceae bacterium]